MKHCTEGVLGSSDSVSIQWRRQEFVLAGTWGTTTSKRHDGLDGFARDECVFTSDTHTCTHAHTNTGFYARQHICYSA